MYVKDTPPSPLLLTAGPAASHQQRAHGLGYSPDPVLAEPLLGLKLPAQPGIGQSPNPGKNLAGTILRIRSDIKCQYSPGSQIVSKLAYTCTTTHIWSCQSHDSSHLPSKSDRICKNMPGDYSNNVSLARRDLTTPLAGRKSPTQARDRDTSSRVSCQRKAFKRAQRTQQTQPITK